MTSRFSRRTLLYSGAAAAGAAALAACTGKSSGSSSSPGGSSSGSGSTKKGDVTTALKRPASIQESPSLKGKGLPPVTDRIPKNPYVVPHRWVGPGKYGGVLHTDIFGTTGAANASFIAEFFYGYSLLRYINDGLGVGPGLAERWSSNAAMTEWTLYFREGTKWSDGKPFTVDDILFWWEDMVIPGHDAQVPPPSNVSSSGKLVTMTKINDITLKFSWDTPNTLFPEQLAVFANGGIGTNGPGWVLPKHYLKQFHPKYNPKVPNDWDTPGGLWEQKADWKRNPDCPTLIGYKCKTFDNNTGIVVERNPYYYAVNTNGDQLPYIDEIDFRLQTNRETIKLQIEQGSTDFLQTGITLADVSTLAPSKDKGNYDIIYWNSGSGTGSMFFFNYDYIAKDPQYGKLIRDKRLIQAVSHGWDRKETQKTLYFGTGQITTGTIGPATSEFHANPDGPKIYRQWRDSYSTLDRAKAKALLAEMELKDTNGDGYVEFPDGSPLIIEVPYSADIAPTEAAKDDQLVADMKKIGLHFNRVPVSPAAFTDQWTTGKLMSHSNWEASNAGSILVSPDWLFPANDNTYWAPLESTWFSFQGTGKNNQELHVEPIKRHPPRMAPDKGSPTEKLTQLYNRAIAEIDSVKRNQLVWEMMKIHINDGPFFLGSTANFQNPIIRGRDLGNVPLSANLALGGDINTWYLPAPAVYDPETWFWTNPDQHS